MGLFSLWRRERPKRARLLDQPILRELPLRDPGQPLDEPPPLPVPRPMSLPEARERTPAPPAPDELRRLLLGAAAANDEEKLAGLCREHEAVIRQNLAAWTEVPPELRASPEAARWYAEGVRAVTRFCAERLGKPEWFSPPNGDAADRPAEAPVALDAKSS